jgi:diketogulonate reductase-like aldo/keto reductase
MGNLEHDLIESQITYALTDEMEYRMIDTAHDSQNELLIRNSIRKAMLFFQKEGRDDAQIHVVTKVSYTHLGYERTKLSVMESLKYLAQPNIRVHVLLNWPRCRDNFASWMNCEQHELDLPDHVKEAGPSPLLNREHAFKESWRALEDVFLKEIDLGEKLPSIESIGVSNFELDDLHELEKNARIRPHLLQGNVWTFLFDTQLMDYCRQKNIQFQAYNVISGIFGRRDATPNALESLIWTANELSGNNQAKFSPAQVVLKWLMQNNVSVIPRTGQIGHLQENSPLAIESLPPLTPNQQDTVRVAVEALLQGNDLDKPQARFVNTNIKMKVHIFWRSDNGQEHPVRENLLPGERFDTMTFPGHVFVVYDDIKSQKKEYTIEAGFGERQHISVLEL